MKSELKENPFSTTWFLTYAFVYGAVCILGALSLAACPAGTKTSVDLTVKVSADTCSENKLAPNADSTWASLACPTVDAGGTVTILFPRTEWNQLKMKAREGAGPFDAGPGK